ncbi:WD40/YVTN/BNR-like repeat-containing protein [Bacillus massilinigeriensis]|uniref:WD40/YVTN/BNR-like repeat-containing protein n=1 Tax=Bacillus mediterraneensis TaxID=1805474 RepID=UPI0008F85870|nr:hypothetical protein [Bacillus mediterraneensis]
MKKYMLFVSSFMFLIMIFGSYYYFKHSSNGRMKPYHPPYKQQENRYADETTDYSLTNNTLSITFNKGKEWITVPVDKESLFDGEYNGDKDELIQNSYFLSNTLTAFLYGDRGVYLFISKDAGKEWKRQIIIPEYPTEQYPVLRFRKVAFLDKDFGYVILTRDRTMSSEMTSVFLTQDGGETWTETSPSPSERLIYDGAFIDEITGFLSYGILNPTDPELFITKDGGKSWSKSQINIPQEYLGIFVIAEMPIKEKGHLSMLVNQGQNGDYKGAKVKGKFISKDNGLTWEFKEEVYVDDSANK